MSTNRLEIAHSSQAGTEASARGTLAKGNGRQYTRRAAGAVARNKRTPTTTKAASGGVGGILGTFGPRFNRFQSVNYTALQQQADLEVGAGGGGGGGSSSKNNNNNNYLSVSLSDSSSEEDLFPTRNGNNFGSASAAQPKRKVRRKMGRRGGGSYSMRDAFDEGRAVSAKRIFVVFIFFNYF